MAVKGGHIRRLRATFDGQDWIGAFDETHLQMTVGVRPTRFGEKTFQLGVEIETSRTARVDASFGRRRSVPEGNKEGEHENTVRRHEEVMKVLWVFS